MQGKKRADFIEVLCPECQMPLACWAYWKSRKNGSVTDFRWCRDCKQGYATQAGIITKKLDRVPQKYQRDVEAKSTDITNFSSKPGYRFVKGRCQSGSADSSRDLGE